MTEKKPSKEALLAEAEKREQADYEWHVNEQELSKKKLVKAKHKSDD